MSGKSLADGVEVEPGIYMSLQGFCDKTGTKPWGAYYSSECWSTDHEILDCELGIRVKNYIDEVEIDGWDALYHYGTKLI